MSQNSNSAPAKDLKIEIYKSQTIKPSPVSMAATSTHAPDKRAQGVKLGVIKTSCFSTLDTLTVIEAAGREHFHTFASRLFLAHKAALFLEHRAAVSYGWWAQIKVQVKIPLGGKKTSYIKRPMHLTS